MKEKSKKEMRKVYDRNRSMLYMRLNPMEMSLLNSMMKDDDWSNMSGFIKYKLFGDRPEEKYVRKLKNIESEKDIQLVLKNLMSQMNDQIDYINIRFNREIDEFKEAVEGMDPKSVNKWMNTISSWQRELQAKTDQIFFDCQTILKRMDIIVERKKQDELRNMPQSILDEYVKNWNDTTSPYMMEAARRSMEKAETLKNMK
jgi:hypothetical protein